VAGLSEFAPRPPRSPSSARVPGCEANPNGDSRPTGGNALRLSRSLVDGWPELNRRVALGALYADCHVAQRTHSAYERPARTGRSHRRMLSLAVRSNRIANREHIVSGLKLNSLRWRRLSMVVHDVATVGFRSRVLRTVRRPDSNEHLRLLRTERDLRPIAAVIDWRKQRLAWRSLTAVA
jgi:hypothetical protein